MPGNSPGEAVRNFLDPIKQAFECVGSGHLHHRDHPPLDSIQSATLNGGEGICVPAVGPYAPSITITADLLFVPIHCPEDEVRGPYRCRGAGYILSIGDCDRNELISFHWHPLQKVSPETKPHMHVGKSRIAQTNTLHIPTPRTSVEDFLMTAIESFGAQPLVGRDTWEPLMTGSRGVYETYRSWDGRHDSPEASDLSSGFADPFADPS